MKNNRQSSIELLRIISMVMIVLGHFLYQSGGLNGHTGITQFALVFIGSGARIAVNLFFMIGMWFMVDYPFSFKRVLKLYGTTWMYTSVITIIIMLLGIKSISLVTILNGFFPFLMGVFWYVTVYIEILLIAPFLQKIFDWNKKKIERLLIVLFLLFSILSTIRKFMDNLFCGLCWGIFLYVLIGYYKKYVRQRREYSPMLTLSAGIFLYTAMTVMKWVFYTQEGTLFQYGYKVMEQHLSDYKCLPNFVVSFLIFMSFVNLDTAIGTNKTINAIAEATFDVYLLHQFPNFYDYLWHGIYKSDSWMNSNLYFLFVALVVISLFFSGFIIMKIRTIFIEPFIFSRKHVICLIGKVDKFYEN